MTKAATENNHAFLVLPMNAIACMRTLFVLAAVVVLQGCAEGDRNVRLGQFPTEATLVCFGHDGKLFQTVVTKGEPLADLIAKWSRDNTSGWSRCFDTFAPSVEYRTPDLTLNVRSDFVVANVKKANGRWIQLKKPTPVALWNDLSKLVAVKANEIAPK